MHTDTRRPILCLILAAALALVACDDAASSNDAAIDTSTAATSTDTSGATDAAASTDTNQATDATTSTDTSEATDATTSTDTSEATDATTSTDTSEATDTTTPTDTTPVACEYIDVQWYIVSCTDSGYTYIKEFVDVEGRADACPPYVKLYDFPYDTLAEALAANPTCDGTCAYTASNSVSLARCTPPQRMGYIIYRAEGCADLYEFAEGLFPSFEAWEAENPCPE